MSPFSYINVTNASFSSLGAVFVMTDMFMMLVKGPAVAVAQSFRNLAGNLSGPVLLLDVNFVNSRSVKSGEIVVGVQLFGKMPWFV